MVILYLPCYEAAVGKQTSKQRLKYEAVICQVKRKMMLAAMTRAEELVKKWYQLSSKDWQESKSYF